MASITRPGGKIVRARRRAAASTPYDRPAPRLFLNPAPENPNWLSRLILSPSRLIVSGAGKVLSSVFGAESSASSSSCSSSDANSTSDGETYGSGNDDDISAESAGEIETTIEMNNTLMKDPEPVEWKSETKYLIEQLLMKETFSREECDRLTNVIKSRVVESPIPQSKEDGKIISIGDSTVSTGTPDLRCTAVTEAKTWLKEKRQGSNSKSESEYGTYSLDSALQPHVTEGEAGSPMDLAKTYMRTRPPWASPSMDHIQSSSQTGLKLFKEATTISVGGNSLTSSKLSKHPPTIGSWNILEELRKVRSKATEEMLRNQPSKIEWSALASDYKGSSVADKVEAVLKDKMDGSAQLVDVPLKWVNAASSPGLKDSQKPQDGMQEDSFPLISATSVTEQSQDVKVLPVVEGNGVVQNGSEGALNFGQHLQPSVVVNATLQRAIAGNVSMDNDDSSRQAVRYATGGDIQGSRLLETNCSTSVEDGTRGVSANGFPSSGLSLPVGQEREQKSTQPADSIDYNPGTDPFEVACEILTEADVEVPDSNEDDSAPIATGLQNSSSIHHEEPPEAIIRQNPKRGLARGMDGVTQMQQGRRVTRYNRRARGW